MKNTEEIINTILIGIGCAIPLSFIAFFTKKAGFDGFCIMFVPVFCAWSVGKITALGKWERQLDEDMKRLKKEIELTVDNSDDDD
jgi:hypothetical protein